MNAVGVDVLKPVALQCTNPKAETKRTVREEQGLSKYCKRSCMEDVWEIAVAAKVQLGKPCSWLGLAIREGCWSICELSTIV